MRILHLLIFCSAFFSKSIAQSYKPLVTRDKNWIFERKHTSGLRCSEWWTIGFSLLHFGVDTIIGNQTYTPLVSKILKIDNQQVVNPYTIIDNGKTLAYFREDTIKRQVFILDSILYDFSTLDGCVSDSNKELLWMDFSLKKGDSIPECMNSYLLNDQFDLRATIDTIVISGEDKIFYTKGHYLPCGDLGDPREIIITEGKGYWLGPFINQYGDHLREYCDGTLEQCGIISALNETKYDHSISISPNPASTYLEVKTNINIDHICLQRLDAVKIGDYTDHIIDIGMLPQGLFILTIWNDGKLVWREKILKL